VDAPGKPAKYREQDRVNKLLLNDGREKLAKLRKDLNKASVKKKKRNFFPAIPVDFFLSERFFFFFKK